MPTSAVGSPERGFTLLELLVVLAIAALATAGVSLALRDSGATALEREAQRLSALLEAARAQSQMQGVPLHWRPRPGGFVFEGLDADAARDAQAWPTGWLQAGVAAHIESTACPGDAPCLVLGPDALLAPQALVLSLRDAPGQRLRLASDGVRPFTLSGANTPP